MAKRMQEVIAQLQHSTDVCSVLVGHSLFFRRFFETYASCVEGGGTSAAVDADVREGTVVAAAATSSGGDGLIAELGQHKLPNCGTVAVLFDFGADGNTPSIIDAQLVFGTTLNRSRASTSAPSAQA